MQTASEKVTKTVINRFQEFVQQSSYNSDLSLLNEFKSQDLCILILFLVKEKVSIDNDILIQMKEVLNKKFEISMQEVQCLQSFEGRTNAEFLEKKLFEEINMVKLKNEKQLCQIQKIQWKQKQGKQELQIDGESLQAQEIEKICNKIYKPAKDAGMDGVLVYKLDQNYEPIAENITFKLGQNIQEYQCNLTKEELEALIADQNKKTYTIEGLQVKLGKSPLVGGDSDSGAQGISRKLREQTRQFKKALETLFPQHNYIIKLTLMTTRPLNKNAISQYNEKGVVVINKQQLWDGYWPKRFKDFIESIDQEKELDCYQWIFPECVQ